MKICKLLTRSTLLGALAIVGTQGNLFTSVQSAEPQQVLGKNRDALEPVHKVYLCLIKEKAEKGVRNPEIALLDEGDYLNFPNFIMPSTSALKSGVCSSVKEKLSLNIAEHDVNPFAHFEYIVEGQKNIHDFMIVLVNSSWNHTSLLFQELGNGPIFYPKPDLNSASKSVRNFDRLEGIQSILYYGFRGEAVSDYNQKSFEKVLKSYGDQDAGYLTITPDIFEKYSKLRVSREIHHDCIIL